ncbi:MAG: hypothetical protein M3356_05420, partial [Actinomycetota bacterium]|nr:hypothetical protein [Actinomycetota bacterium]
HRSQPTAKLGEVIMTDRVDATLDAKQRPLSYPRLDGALAESECTRLSASDHTVLSPQQNRQTTVERR